jgi:hypothetical protein
MKLKHALEIKEAMGKWAAEDGVIKEKQPCIVCSATRFNWEAFYASKVGGNSISFLAMLYSYLTSEQITKALMKITSIDGSGICGSGVSHGSI